MSGSDAIFIRRLSADTIIGVNDWERQQTQTLWLSLTLQLDTRAAASSNSVVDTLDYAAVAEFVRDYLQAHSHRLIETLANSLCSLLLQRHSGLSAVTLTVEKPDAVAGCESLGVRIHRQRVSDV